MSSTIIIKDAKIEEAGTVALLVRELLIELEPEAKSEINRMDLDQVSFDLFEQEKLFALLAKDGREPVGVLTLHQCAAIYAGGIFGEISELYVDPDYRSKRVGQLLLEAAIEKGRAMGWKRLEVGSPPPDEWPRTVKFYEKNQFEATGTRLRRLISPTK